MTSSARTLARPQIDSGAWQSVRPLDLDALARARVETINLLQWLARMENSYLPASLLEERLLLEYRPASATFITKPFDQGLTLALYMPSLEMQFHKDAKAVPHVFDPEERSPAEVEAWLLVELLHHGVDRTKFAKTLPHHVPDLMTGDADDHSPQACQKGLAQLTAWFRKAAAILDAAAWREGDKQVSIVCRPQTLGLRASHIEAGGLEVGFIPGDAENAEPYFYRERPAKIGAGRGRARSILSASEMLAASDPAAAAFAFLTAGTA
jgi:hypothetical protein